VGKALGRPSWLPVPGFALHMALGEMADELILSGQRALPKKLLDAGYAFQYPSAREALQNILSG
jgi:NAD dependent epimerase/dehydratase family enzyme